MNSLPALLLGLCAAVSPARAAQAAPPPAATLALTVGLVKIESGGAARSATTGDAVAAGDVVTTGEGATAILALADGSRLKLRESSRLRLTPPEAHSRSTEVMLYLGGVFASVTKRSAGAEFQVRTPGAVAAVRGTQFFTAYGRTHGKSKDLWVCVNEGVVEVGSVSSKKRLSVPAGKGVLIKGEKNLTAPQAYDWTKKLNWNMDAAKGEVEDKTSLDAAYSNLLDQDYR